MLPKFLIIGGAGASIFVAACVLADDKHTGYDTSLVPPAASKAGVTYGSDVQPIFEKSCYPCHGPKTPKPKDGLRLDSLAAVLKGGKEGVVVVPGDIAKSSMMSSVAHLGDPDDYMPPPKNKGHIEPLTKAQIGLIRAWIEQGAK